MLNLKNKKIFLLLILFFSLFLFCKKEEKHSHSHDMQHEGYPRNIPDAIKCDVHTSGCKFDFQLKDNTKIEALLDLTPKPVYAMKDVEFQLQFKPDNKLSKSHIMLDLTMPAMYMGDNKVELKEVSAGLYKGKGVFPECTTDDRLWNIEIMIHLENGEMVHKNIQFDIKQ